MTDTILALDGLTVRYPVRQGLGWREITALHPTDLDIARGETLAVVGESGSGKTTLGRAMLRLVEPSGGAIRYGGTDLVQLAPRRLRALRPRFQMIFQDPYSSLNPRRRIGAMLDDVLAHVGVPASERVARARALITSVGLDTDALERLPSAFSGGQRQRIAIARALATEPQIIVADEPVSALDVSIQAQVVNLLIDLKRERGLTLVFISHDLGIVSAIADRIAVMYFGEIVELAPAGPLAANPAHPYSAMLLRATPRPDVAAARETIRLATAAPSADLPSQLDPPAGCPFRSRCPRATGRCAAEAPRLMPMPQGGLAACHNPLPANATHDERGLVTT
ncbi:MULTISPECIES: oligopeptide/dipeptide ABC transporter ATP-binding protein [unclassified Roseitalea]|uniref:ABC transporter ATP-binding protein n=1 Tax=unclassified Roseitalea TaxID=2639107 RepID=UPI00273F8ACA|nr:MULTISPECIES: oligopeptide/dipeptide ABC transporter ATP-binding protein [unclassified Roseitalea]